MFEASHRKFWWDYFRRKCFTFEYITSLGLLCVISEVRGSNPVIGSFDWTFYGLSKTKMNAPFELVTSLGIRIDTTLLYSLLFIVTCLGKSTFLAEKRLPRKKKKKKKQMSFHRFFKSHEKSESLRTGWRRRQRRRRRYEEKVVKRFKKRFLWEGCHDH